MQYSKDELNEILRLHGMWLRGERDGKRANLTGAYLANADLRYANLRYATLRGADLTDANLRGANLTGADLTDANMIGANLRYANMTSANLTNAYLRGANLTNAYMTGVNLRGANLWDTIGNMREIKSMHLERWGVTYTHDRLQIGCQNHAIEDWQTWRERPDWIDHMDDHATEWAGKYLDHVLVTIELSPVEGGK
jgi:uncharacterized protein YjbI with pentapeptide repeats